MSDPKFAKSEEKYLSRLDVWAMALGCMVGWGAFVMPGSTFLPVAGPAGTVISMAVGLAVILVIGKCITYLMTHSAAPGGIYAYIKEALGRDHAFLCSWFLCLSYLTIVFLNGTALFLVLRAMLGDAVYRGYSYTVAGRPVYVYEVLLSMSALVGIGLLALLARSVLRRLATILALILVAGIAVTAAVCLPHADMRVLFGTFGCRDVSLGFAVFSLVVLAPWAFVGFEVVTFDTARFAFPLRKVRGVVFCAIVVAALAYTLMALSSAAVIPDGYDSWPAYISSLGKLSGIVSIPTFYAAKKTMGTAGLAVIGVTALAAILTGIIGADRATVNLLSTMAGDKILSARFLKTRYCIFFIMGLSILVSILGRNTLSWFIDLTAFGAIVAYGYTSLAACRIARKENDRAIVILGAAGTVISVLFGIAQLVPRLVALDAMCSEAFLLLSLWCLLGFVFYWRMVRRSSLVEYSSMATSGLVLFTLLLYAALLWLGKLLMGKNDLAELQNTLITGGIFLLLIVFVGLTVMLYIQNRVSKMHEAAKRERIRLSEGSLARNQFLLNMSHDIRTPMDAVIGYTDLALKEPDSMLRDYLKKIDRSARQLKTLLDNILEMSRSESDKFDLELVPTDLRLDFEALRGSYLEAAEKKGIGFSVLVSRVQDPYVWCDREDLFRVVSDLVARSLELVREGGSISLAVFETGHEGSDYGSYELRLRISGAEGAAPDLAGAKDMIGRMGGAVEAFSSPENGIEIVMRVKLRFADEKDVKKELAAAKAAGN